MRIILALDSILFQAIPSLSLALIIVVSTRPYHTINIMKILYAFYGVGVQKNQIGVFADIHGPPIIHPVQKSSPVQGCHLKNMRRLDTGLLQLVYDILIYLQNPIVLLKSKP
jgi:hypothetical protein